MPAIGVELHKRFCIVFGTLIKSDISSNLTKLPDERGIVFVKDPSLYAGMQKEKDQPYLPDH